jgi:hypothetical protein
MILIKKSTRSVIVLLAFSIPIVFMPHLIALSSFFVQLMLVILLHNCILVGQAHFYSFSFKVYYTIRLVSFLYPCPRIVEVAVIVVIIEPLKRFERFAFITLQIIVELLAYLNQ